MSGYPYGGYPPNSGYQPPPPGPMYNDNQSCASLYGTPTPPMANNNYPPGPYDQYGGVNQMPNVPYGMSSAGNYPPPPMYNQPPQQFGGYGNSQYAQPYPVEPTPSFGGQYPNTFAPPMYGGMSNAPFQPSMPYSHEQSSIYLASLEQYQGTIFPIPNFNPDADCQALRHAMKGAGTNERVLMDIIVNRSNMQRQQIKHHYKSMFGVDITKEVEGETSGNFKEAMVALFDAPASYEAHSLHQALNHSKEGTLREILLTRTNAEIRAIAVVYQQMFNKSLEHDIQHRAHGTDFKRLLISAAQANREELNPQQIQQARQMGIESVIDRNRARQDAHDLYKAGAGKIGTDERTFNLIFSHRSYYQLRATFEEYQHKYGKDITQVIRSEFSGDIKDAYLALIQCIRDRPTFFAERLHKAISGLGTRDSTLIRIIITRSEIDLAQIKQRYHQMYHRQLAQDVSGDTSGDYKRLLLSVIK